MEKNQMTAVFMSNLLQRKAGNSYIPCDKTRFCCLENNDRVNISSKYD